MLRKIVFPLRSVFVVCAIVSVLSGCSGDTNSFDDTSTPTPSLVAPVPQAFPSIVTKNENCQLNGPYILACDVVPGQVIILGWCFGEVMGHLTSNPGNTISPIQVEHGQAVIVHKNTTTTNQFIAMEIFRPSYTASCQFAFFQVSKDISKWIDEVVQTVQKDNGGCVVVYSDYDQKQNVTC